MHLETELSELALEEAVFYIRLGLQLEVLTLNDVSNWVDEVLLRETTPDSFFMGLYSRLHTDKQQVLPYLAQAFPVTTFSVRPTMGWLYQQLTKGERNLGKVIRSLYRLRTLVESEVEVGWIYGLAADYERCAGGSAEAIREVYQETEAFLACYQEYTFANRPQWLYLDAVVGQRLANLRH